MVVAGKMPEKLIGEGDNTDLFVHIAEVIDVQPVKDRIRGSCRARASC